MSEAQNRARKKYKAASVKRLTVDFYPTDAELLEHINSQPNKQGYIKDLIRADMKSIDSGGTDRPHGYWIKGWDTVCSVCRMDCDVYDVDRFGYCPNCGAVMDMKK